MVAGSQVSTDSRSGSQNLSILTNLPPPLTQPRPLSTIQVITNSEPPSTLESLTPHEFFYLKLTANIELEEVTATSTGIIVNAKNAAVDALKNEYDKILAEWDTTRLS